MIALQNELPKFYDDWRIADHDYCELKCIECADARVFVYEIEGEELLYCKQCASDLRLK